MFVKKKKRPFFGAFEIRFIVGILNRNDRGGFIPAEELR